MEAGSSSSGERPPKRQKASRTSITYEASVQNLSNKGRETLTLVNNKKQVKTMLNNDRTVFDHTCPDFNWLHPGWIVEDRLVNHRRYRYYYDPLGQMYSCRGEVELMLDIEKSRANKDSAS